LAGYPHPRRRIEQTAYCLGARKRAMPVAIVNTWRWRGDNHLRGLLYEAAVVILTRTTANSALRIWGLKLKEKIGFKRAAVAVACKLAVIMHTMLRSGELFDRSIATEV
jgi:transposase